MSGFLCSGNVRVAHVDADGLPIGNYIGIVNAVKLALNKPAPDLKKRVSKQNESFGETLDQVEFPKGTEVSLSTDDTGDAEILAWALGGTKAGFTQASAIGTTKTIAKITMGQWSDVGSRRISNMLVKDSTDTTIYGVNVDYLLDAKAGFIKFIGTILADDAEIHLIFDEAALTGETVSVGTRQAIQVRIDGDMRNIATGEQVRVVIPKAKLSAAGELDFMGEDFLVTQMNGSALVLPGQAAASVTPIDGA